MKLTHKIYLLQILLALVLFGFLGFTYLSYEKQYKKDIAQSVNREVFIKKKELLNAISQTTQRLQKNRKLYLRIHQRALSLLQHNKHISLQQLKQQLIQDFALKDISIEIYLINNKYTIFKTTFPKDLGFDLSVIPDAKEWLDKTTKNKKIYIADIVSIDALDMGYRIYSYSYLQKGVYLELGFQDNDIQNSLTYTISKTDMPLSKTKLYTIENDGKRWSYYEIGSKEKIEHKENFFQTMKKFPIGKNSYGDPIIDAHLLHKTYITYQKDYAEVITPLYDENMFSKIGHINFIMDIYIDISDKVAVLEKTKQIFYTSIFILLGILLFIFFYIKHHFTKKIDTIVRNINNKSTIDDVSIITPQDELSFVAKEYNALFNSLNKEIEINKTLLKENKRFIADTVHQIRTPLTNIMMNSEMIERSLSEGQVTNFTDQINASINMLTNSYEDLAYILSYDNIEYKATHISLTALLQERVKFFHTISKVNFKPIHTQIENDFVIEMNPIECERLIDNNISNAIKYATPNKSITITLSQQNNTIVLEFRTYGSEIKNKEKLFEKNYRENESKRGLGLGLNMVKNICQKYNIIYSLSYQDGQNIFTYTFFQQ